MIKQYCINLTKNVLKNISMHSKATFGEFIRKLREDQKLPIRKVAAFLDIDPSTLSKIERGERYSNKDQIKKLSELFGVVERKLLVEYLSDKVTDELFYEELPEDILRVAEEKIKYRKSKTVLQAELDFEKIKK
jgi:HTH-type transcriptional regulator, competence development regulator